jgi:hypothetical protein
MQPLIALVSKILNDPDAISIGYQQVDNFHKLILDQLPYGQIDPDALVQGLIEFDGPAQSPPNGKKPLQWYFGGVPREICKAIRIQYSYQKYVAGTQVYATGSLFIGYELNEPYASRETARLRVLEEQANRLGEAARAEPDNADGATAAADAQREYDDAARTLDPWSGTPPQNTQELFDWVRRIYRNYPTTVTSLAKFVDATNFDAFIDASFPFRTTDQIREIREQAPAYSGTSSRAASGPTRLSEMLGPDDSTDKQIEFDGPARDYNSYKPFPYTTESLFNDPSGLYNKVLWWYFGGSAFRITKAMRIPCTNDDFTGSLLVGYQGPGPS